MDKGLAVLSSLAFRLLEEFVRIRGLMFLKKRPAGSRLGLLFTSCPTCLVGTHSHFVLRALCLPQQTESVCSSGRLYRTQLGRASGRVGAGERKEKGRNKKRNQRLGRRESAQKYKFGSWGKNALREERKKRRINDGLRWQALASMPQITQNQLIIMLLLRVSTVLALAAFP